MREVTVINKFLKNVKGQEVRVINKKLRELRKRSILKRKLILSWSKDWKVLRHLQGQRMSQIYKDIKNALRKRLLQF